MRCTRIPAIIAALCLCTSVGAFNVQQLISKANIYYQQPLQDGGPSELTLDKVHELRTKLDFKVIIHGYLGTRTHSSIKPLGNAYKAKGVPNVFLADWKDAAYLDYYSSRQAVQQVAVHFGKMLDAFFSKHGIERSEVHVIGHSLGAHIAGDIGQYFNGTLGRVTGLDPALPLFTQHAADSLHANAAQFVDVIHTDFPVFGDLTPRGTVDFYPNFGQTPQRGCEEVDLLTASKFIFEAYSCSHNRAVIFYAESIGLPDNFPAIPCSFNAIWLRNSSACPIHLPLAEIRDTHVTAATTTVEDGRQAVYMGEKVSRNASGYYYLETHATPPYGMGRYAQF